MHCQLAWPAATLQLYRFPCRVVGLLQQYITLTLYQQQSITQGVEAATKLLGLVHTANNTTGEEQPVCAV